MNKKNVLVVEDDQAIRNLITTTLELHDYHFKTADTGTLGICMAASHNPDIIILDLGLPDLDGLEVITKIRSWSEVPIIIVSARGEDIDKVHALDLGADDYLVKPFSVDELLARLRVMLRRTNHLTLEPNAIFINGDIKIDYAAGCVFLDSVEIHMTPIEYRLLCLLSKNLDRVLTHNYLLNEIWGHASIEDVPSLRVFMATLRKKIEVSNSDSKYIQTHIGVGYRMIRISE